MRIIRYIASVIVLMTGLFMASPASAEEVESTPQINCVSNTASGWSAGFSANLSLPEGCEGTHAVLQVTNNNSNFTSEENCDIAFHEDATINGVNFETKQQAVNVGWACGGGNASYSLTLAASGVGPWQFAVSAPNNTSANLSLTVYGQPIPAPEPEPVFEDICVDGEIVQHEEGKDLPEGATQPLENGECTWMNPAPEVEMPVEDTVLVCVDDVITEMDPQTALDFGYDAPVDGTCPTTEVEPTPPTDTTPAEPEVQPVPKTGSDPKPVETDLVTTAGVQSGTWTFTPALLGMLVIGAAWRRSQFV